MRIYTFEQRYDEQTGEEIDPVPVLDHVRREFSGEVIDSLEEKPYPAYRLDYEDMDPFWALQSRYMDLDLGEELERFSEQEGNPAVRIRASEFLRSQEQEGDPYTIKNTLISEAMQEYQDRFETVSKYSFAAYLRDLRIETAHRLISQDEIEPKQLGGVRVLD